MPDLVVRNCRVLAGPDARDDGRLHDVHVDGRTIREVRPAGGAAAARRVIEGDGGLLAPGIVNGHQHSHEHLQKGRFPNLPLELWMNYVRPPKAVRLTERQVYLRTMVGALEALQSGTTTLVDDLSIGPVPDRRHYEAACQAYEDIGIRALVGVSMMDRPFFDSVPFVDEEFDADLLDTLRRLPQPDGEAFLELCEALARERHPRESRVGFIVAPSAPQRCSEAFLLRARALADRFDLPLMIHVQETRLQAVTARHRFGCTMVEYLDRIGFLRRNTTLIHGVWLTPHEIRRLAETGATVQHNPWSNLRLGSGLAPLQALLEAGVNVSLGSDGCGSTDTCNMLTVIGCASVLHTLRGDDPARWPGAREAWRAATVGGATALGLGDRLGTIEPGRAADFVLYRTDRVPFLPLNDALRQLCHAERGASIEAVVVDGEVVLAQGRPTRIDADAIGREIAREFEALHPAIADAEASAEQIRPAMQRIYERCLAEAVADGIIATRLPG